MRDIQTDGTPTATAAPASIPKTRRRVIGTAGSRMGGQGGAHEALYGVRRANMEPAAQFTAFATPFGFAEEKRYVVPMACSNRPRAFRPNFLGFRRLQGFNPRTSRK